MEYKGVEVAVHEDIEDEDQTVYIPDVHTTATAANTTKDHVTGANEDLIITDEVVLTGLKVGNEYTVKGVLMDKSAGEELKANDESITAEETFTADATEMTITLTYTLDAKTLAGTTTVVFETLYTEGKEIGRHHEIDDEARPYISRRFIQQQPIKRTVLTIPRQMRKQPSLIPYTIHICFLERNIRTRKADG